MQVALVRFIQQVEDGGVLRVEGGTHAAWRLVQHEIACGFACLQGLTITLHAAEFANVMVGVGNRQPIDVDPALRQQQAHLLAIETGQVAEEPVETHYRASALRNCSSTWAQRGHRQALLRSASGNASSTAGSILTL